MKNNTSPKQKYLKNQTSIFCGEIENRQRLSKIEYANIYRISWEMYGSIKAHKPEETFQCIHVQTVTFGLSKCFSVQEKIE